mgnify:CR=1 FL=1
MIKKKEQSEVVIVTGPSGAGKTTAISVLQDIGFETIDNIPIDLIDRVLSGPGLVKPLALGIDVRTRGFSAENLNSAIAMWSQNKSLLISLLFLDCNKGLLEQRFNQTRRRHPLSEGDTLQNAIFKEDGIIKSLKQTSDILIDTSNLNPHALKEQLCKFFDKTSRGDMVLSVHSFSYRRSVPPGIDMVFDCRFLRNPYWVQELQNLTGKEAKVGDYIKDDENWFEYLNKIVQLLKFLIPKYREEGKSYFAIGFGCTGGKHRSVFTSEVVAKSLRRVGWQVIVRHRELENKNEFLSLKGTK